MYEGRDGPGGRNRAEVFELMIHGVCRGWLPPPADDGSSAENDGRDSVPLLDFRPRAQRFAAGALVSAAVAFIAFAVIVSGATRNAGPEGALLHSASTCGAAC